MKRQLNLLLSSLIGINALAAVAVLQPPLFAAQLAAQGDPIQTMAKGRGGSAWSEVENLNLTAEQEEDINAIKAGVAEQMAEILTPEQLETFRAAQASGDDMRSTMMGLGLTRSQRSDVIGVMRDAQDDIMAVLTPEQRAQIAPENPRDRN
ncbi:MAG: Spy/CpxP family protein refolding chaperone [Cyanobacteria bacterium P01_A01_bin.114]